MTEDRPTASVWKAATVTAIVLTLATALGVRLWIGTRPVVPMLMPLDLLHYFYPSARHMGEELAAGRIPLWNPYLAFGTSHVADIQLATFYPPTLLSALLSAVSYEEVFALAHIALAALGVFLLGRAAGLGATSALVAALTLASGESLHILAGWPAILATLSWCPVAFFAARRVGDTPGLASALVLTAVLGLQILAGYPQLHLYTVLCLPLFAVPSTGVFSFAMVRVGAWLAIAESWAAAVGAIALLPATQAVRASIRHRSVIPDWFYEAIPIRWPDYVAGIAAHRAGKVPLFFTALVPLLVLAAILGRRAAPRLRRPLLVFVAIAVVLSLGQATPIFPLLWKLPVSHWLTGPYKWTLLLAPPYALLAGVGCEAVLGRDPDRRLGRGARALWIAGGLAVLVLLPFSVRQRALGGALLLAIGWLGHSPSRLTRGALTAAIVAGIVGGSALSWDRRGAGPSEIAAMFERYAPAFRLAASLQSDDHAGRVFGLGPPLWFPLRQAEVERVAQANAMGTFETRRVFDLLGTVQESSRAESRRAEAIALIRSVGGELILTPHGANPWLAGFGLEPLFTSDVADLWRDRAALPRIYLAEEVLQVDTPEVLSRLGSAAPGERVAIVEPDPELPPLPTTVGPGDVELVSDDVTALRVRVHVDGPALLVLLDAWHPDWKAWVDGEPTPIRRANFIGRAVALPPGARNVVFRFVPRSFHAGAALSLVALAAWLASALALRVRRHRYRGEPGERART